ncbi:14834_t:CDS:2, partial [Gigaspora margarita]
KYRNAKAITYSGPTFIRICSGKHDTSTNYTRSKDFDNLMFDERLHTFTTIEDGQFKPVVLMLTDARIILPHDTFGSHLDKQLKTADNELEKFLFEYVNSEEYYQSKLDEKSVAWIERHTMTCRYITQIFFSPPILVQQKSNGICAASINASDDTMHFILLLTNLLTSTSALSVINTSVSNDKGETMWIKENTISEDAPESLFQKAKHIRTNQDHQAYLID